MKKILLVISISIIVILLNSCNKIKDTYVIVIVIDNNDHNVGAGTIVHMFENSPDENLGSNPMFSETSMTTNASGQAEFLLTPGQFVDDGYDVISRFFTIFEVNDDPFIEDKVIGTASINIEYGKTQNLTIKISE
ncbi:MAG: hypothetical protein JXL97_06930 [Bacteroidales bacterium]|nr:hypothetical protein [Bacteroidales bacterium]